LVKYFYIFNLEFYILHFFASLWDGATTALGIRACQLAALPAKQSGFRHSLPAEKGGRAQTMALSLTQVGAQKLLLNIALVDFIRLKSR
jgi:hypothetical protein